jgi:large subunit ribosomal protein L9
MKVILLKAVQKVGKKDDVVEVSEGYARNALLPTKKAIPATPDTLADLARRKAGVVAEKALRHELLDRAIKSLAGQAVTIPVRANEKGSMFSSITKHDVGKFLADTHRISIDESCIILPQPSIKELGEYVVTIKDEDYTTTFPLIITAKK